MLEFIFTLHDQSRQGPQGSIDFMLPRSKAFLAMSDLFIDEPKLHQYLECPCLIE
jgi:hypothetical protein